MTEYRSLAGSIIALWNKLVRSASLGAPGQRRMRDSHAHPVRVEERRCRMVDRALTETQAT
jgi:hypothetical protein